MNQTKKRLSIIKIAISITDIETIQLQILKLGLLKTDEKIQNIISMLQAENYAQAQGLITTYIETPTENILQRSSQERKQTFTKEEQSTVDEFQLFVTPNGNEKKVEIDINDYISDDLQIPTVKSLEKEKKREPIEKIQEIEEIDINDFLSVAPVIPSKQTERDTVKTSHIATNDFDSLLNMDANDVLTDNIDLKINYTEEDNFFALPSQSPKTLTPTSDIPKDTFFDIPDSIDILSPTLMQNTKVEEVPKEESFLLTQEEPLQDEPLEKNIVEENILQEEKNPLQELSPSDIITEDTAPTHYKSIPYISQKLESMHKQYPSPYSNYEPFSALSGLLTKIRQETYLEEEIEEILGDVKKLKGEQQFSQATQLLLVCASTPSPFAQLNLARELYKGILLTQNIPQAFILLNTLAMDDYPEALCDLGQFYENGIGTKKDKKRAEHLYKDAMEFGIKRAKTHFERLKQQNKGFFRK
ncbi:MAG: hypothetical protein DRG09_02545 [Epsilonproteobacteria bacterium]|nr:MAG: hypothetical protein DRG09_02545 [Campylobacterota bacterium]